MTKIILRKTKKPEIKMLAKIYMEEFSKPPYNENWTLRKAMEKIIIFKKLYDCYTIKYGSKIVGFIAINPTFMCPGAVAFGEDVVIKSNFQKKGIGTTILKKIFKKYKEKRFKYFMGISHKKSKALKLYNKLGFNKSKDFILIEKELD